MSGLTLPVYPVSWRQFCSVVDEENLVERKVWTDHLQLPEGNMEDILDLSESLPDAESSVGRTTEPVAASRASRMV